MAGCNAKTLRRAIQAAQLSRHYLLSPHGPQLVFHPEELKQWIARRQSSRPTPERQTEIPPSTDEGWSELPELLAGLQARLGESRSMMERLAARIEDQDRLIDRAHATIVALAASLRERDLPAHPASLHEDDQTLATPSGSSTPRTSDLP